MRVFLSVAGPERPLAEEVALALRGEGHKVFLDQQDLPPGESYHRRIRDAIAAADLMVFFVSPLSIEPKRYTLAELKFAQDKWPHPQGRVLPVFAAPTDPSKVPAYLRAVSIYTVKGNMAAEVANEINRMAERLKGAFTASQKQKLYDEGRNGNFPTALPNLTQTMVLNIAAIISFAALAVLAGYMTNDLDRSFMYTANSGVKMILFHGLVLALLVSIAAIFFKVKDFNSILGLSAGCFAAYAFEALGKDGLRDDWITLFTGKSIIFATCAALAFTEIRDLSRWAFIAGSGCLAGVCAKSNKLLLPFIWELSTVTSISCLLALNEFAQKSEQVTQALRARAAASAREVSNDKASRGA